MWCSICQHEDSAEILLDYARTRSLRITAEHYGIGYRSLARHLKVCLYAILENLEEEAYKADLAEAERLITEYYLEPETYKRRKKSIIKKPIKFSWSRRAWKTKNSEKECLSVTTKNKRRKKKS
jgi:hypothetical protein